MWTGKDHIHNVYCVLRDGTWSVTADSPTRGRFPVDISPSVQQLLTQLLQP